MTALGIPVDAVLVERLGWTLLHSLWQIVLLSVVYVTVTLLVRRSAGVRYVAGCVLLGLMLVAPVVTFSVMSVDSPTKDVAAERVDGTANGGARVDLAGSDSSLPRGLVDEGAASGVGSNVPPLHSVSNEHRRMSHRLLEKTTDRLTIGPETPPQSEVLVSEKPQVGSEWLAAGSEHLKPWLAHIATAWFAGVMLLWLRLAFGVFTVRRLRHAGRSSVPESIDTQFRSLVNRVGISRAVAITQSSLVQIPSVIGVLRPIVLLPVSVVTGLSSEQLEVVLAHELAHVRRYDFLANVLQTVVESLLFYHPCMWWVSCCVRRERENCCDDFALRICTDRGHYARTLMTVEEICGAAPQMLVAANGGSLVRRVRRIAGVDSVRSSTSAGAFVAAVLLIGSVATLVYAQNLGSETASRSSRAESMAHQTQSANADESSEGDTTSDERVSVPVGRTIETWIGSLDPELGEHGSLDVERSLTLPTPPFPTDPESDYQSKRHGVWKWALRHGVDFAGDFESGLLATVQSIAELDEGTPADRLTLEAATELVDRRRGERTWTTLIPRTSRGVFVFRTHHGSVGVIQISGLDEQRRRLKVRFRLLSRGETETSRAVVTQWMNAIRDLDNVQPTWGLTAPSMRTIGAVDQINHHLWKRHELRVQRALGNKQTQLVVTNPIRDNSGRELVAVFQVVRHEGQWLINEADLYEPDETESMLWGFQKNAGVVWDVRESDVIGEWVHQFFVLRAYISIRPDHTIHERRDGEQSAGTWQLDGNRLTFTFEGSEPYQLTVTRVGPDSFSFTNSEGSLSTYRRQKPPNGLASARKVTLTDLDEADRLETLDIDSGRLIATSGRPDEWTDEMKRGDLVVEYAKNRWSLGTRGMTVAQLPDRFWKTPSSRELDTKLREALDFPGPFPTVESGGLTFHQLPQLLEFPMVVGFSTDDGAIGLLRLVRDFDEPRRLVIEYRLVDADDGEATAATGEDATGGEAAHSTDGGREARELALIFFVRESFGANENAAKDAAFTFAMMELHEETLLRFPTLLSEGSLLDRMSFEQALKQLEDADHELPPLQATAVKLHRKQPLTRARLLIATRLLNALLQPFPTKRLEEPDDAQVTQEQAGRPVAVDVRANPELIDPSEGVVLDPNYLWRTSHCAVGQNTDYVWEDRSGRYPIFSVGEPLRRHVWNRIEFMPVDPERYPFLVLTYRAENLSKEDRPFDYILWFSDEQARGGEGKGIHAVMNSDLIDDGKLRELVVDLRKVKPRGFDRIRGLLDDFWLGVKAGPDATGESPARFEFVGLRFDADDSKRHDAIKIDERIKVRVVDFHGRPVAGAKVTVDAQRINFARSAVTDANGRVSVTPLKNRVGMHMLRIEKDGWCPAEIPNVGDALEPSGLGGIVTILGIEQTPADEVRVVLHPARQLTGKLQNEDGEAIANASVELSVPALDNLYVGAAEIVNKVQLRTDEHGIWMSPPLPSNGASVDIRLSHPDYVDDPRSRDFPTDEISLESIRNGDLVLTMYRGATISANVRTADDGPADGTRVVVQTDHGQVRGFVDSAGRLEIRGVPTGSYHMLLTRNGHAPELIERTAEQSVNDLGDISLRNGRKVTGRVVDTNGEPVADARVEVTVWRKRRLLRRSTKTKDDGTWTLWNMPLDEFTIRARSDRRTCDAHTVRDNAEGITLKLGKQVTQ